MEEWEGGKGGVRQEVGRQTQRKKASERRRGKSEDESEFPWHPVQIYGDC